MAGTVLGPNDTKGKVNAKSFSWPLACLLGDTDIFVDNGNAVSPVTADKCPGSTEWGAAVAPRDTPLPGWGCGWCGGIGRPVLSFHPPENSVLQAGKLGLDLGGGAEGMNWSCFPAQKGFEWQSAWRCDWGVGVPAFLQLTAAWDKSQQQFWVRAHCLRRWETKREAWKTPDWEEPTGRFSIPITYHVIPTTSVNTAVTLLKIPLQISPPANGKPCRISREKRR